MGIQKKYLLTYATALTTLLCAAAYAAPTNTNEVTWTETLVPIGSSLIVGLIVAVVTARTTVRLALRRFYSEKWWQRKSAAYTAIIESMHHLREHADTNLAFMMKDRELPKEGEELLDRNLRQAMADLRKHRDLGTFVISAEAIAILNSLFKELDRSAATGMWLDYLEIRVAALDKSLEEMRMVARKDLSLA